MSILSGSLNQNAVYWRNTGKDGYGKLTFASAIQIKVRWEDKQEKYISREGKDIISKSIVYLEYDTPIDSYLYLGDIKDLSSAQKADPTLVSTALPIKIFHKVPDLDLIDYVRKAIV